TSKQTTASIAWMYFTVSSLKDRRVDFGLRPARLLNLCYELVPREQAADCRLIRIVEDSLLLDDPYTSWAAHPRHSLTERFRVHISPRLAPNKTRWHRQLEHRAATPNAARTGAAAKGRA